jgi:Xaa-Pro dipeptidase
MKLSRRQWAKTALTASGGVVAGALFGSTGMLEAEQGNAGLAALPPAFDKLQPLGDRVKPVTTEEFKARIAHAQQSMTDASPRFDALFISPSTSLTYFTGIRWSLSERIVAMLVPRTGDPLLISPAFEEGRLRELMRWPIELRVWQEDENPHAIAASWLAERGIRTGRVAVEETTKYVFFDGLRSVAPALEYASANPITVGCRAQKSEHEQEFMRLACEATFDVYRATFASLHEGVSQREVTEWILRGYQQMALSGYSIVLFGAAAALPHGTKEDKTLQSGMGVLIDGGTTVEGYQSDVTRTTVFGRPSGKLARAFDVVRKSQDAALAAAVAGKDCGSVDDAARKVIVDAGFGPGYKYFTHRVGHGIGLDGHEWPYLVRGNRTTLKPAMTFSDEPGIYVPGEYGVRCEDLMLISESGSAKLITPYFARSLEQPFA